MQWDINEVGKLYIRPWGTYKTLEQRDNYQIKHIVVYPGHRLSYHFHRHREEIWTLIKGVGIVTLSDKRYTMNEGSTIKIPKEALHRITNDTKYNVEFIEVQLGDYLGEDDNVRWCDDYGRVN